MKRMWLVGLLALAASSVATGASAQGVAKGQNEVTGEVFAVTAKSTDDADRFNRADFSIAYSRLVTDRLAVGPRIAFSKFGDNDVSGNYGGQVRYYFGNLAGRAIPFAEVNSTRTFNDATANNTDLQVMGGLMFPMGKTGGSLRVSPYYYRVFFDEDKLGFSNYQAFGISWGVALRF